MKFNESSFSRLSRFDIIKLNERKTSPSCPASALQYFPQAEIIDILPSRNLRYDPSMFIILIYETFSVELMT